MEHCNSLWKLKRKDEPHLRAYIAIDFEDNIKNHFDKITSNLKDLGIEGSFTEKNNFHMTIRFIGEVDNLQITRIKEVIEKVALEVSPFELLIKDLGIFRKKNTNILWLGVEESTILSELNKGLSTLLIASKIPFYDKLFMPHVTLGRRVLFDKAPSVLKELVNFERISIPVNSISLMVSKEENGKLNGVPIYQIKLKDL